MPRYRCFGLVLHSQLPLPELETAADGAELDLVIREAELSAPEPDAVALADGLWRRHDRCGVDIAGVARFESRAGREILVDRRPGADPAAVRLYVLGTLMGAVLMQRGHLVLHGNAFRSDSGCAVVVGPSGAGKSTLAAEMQRRRHDVLTDDVAPIDPEGRALAGYPRIKLWDDALERLGVATSGLARVHADHPKFELPLSRPAREALPVRAVYALEVHDGPLTLVPAHGVDAFRVLAGNTYRRQLVHGPAEVIRHLQQCRALIRRAPVIRMLRSPETSVEETAQAILAHMSALRGATTTRLSGATPSESGPLTRREPA